MHSQQTPASPQGRIIASPHVFKEPARARPAALPMTHADLEDLRAEVRELRLHGRSEIAERLRDARQYGDGSNNDELHAVREEQMVIGARIALLEHVIARAAIAEPPERNGIVGIGSTVSLEDVPSGAIKTYRLASAHAIGDGTISAASPMGQALIGSRAGAVVSLELPNGRSRSVRVVSVERDRRPAADDDGMTPPRDRVTAAPNAY
jgi:transcription elongation factor GreA